MAVACASNLKQFGNAFNIYGAENSGAMPPAAVQWGAGGNPPPPSDGLLNGWKTDYAGLDPAWASPSGYSLWQHFLWPQLKTLNVFICPAHQDAGKEDYAGAGAVHGDWVLWWHNYMANKSLLGPDSEEIE